MIPFSSSKGHLYLSYSPKAEPGGWDIIPAPQSHSGSMVLQPSLTKPFSFETFVLLLLSLQCPFTYLEETQFLQRQHLEWSLSSVYLPLQSPIGVPSNSLAQLFNSSRDTLVIAQKCYFKIADSETCLSVHNVLLLTSGATTLPWNLFLCPHHDSWVLALLYSP